MNRILSLAAAMVLLAGCEPEYADAPAHSAAVEAHHEDPGGADPTAVSGRVKDSAENSIHHNRADGNAGRPADGPGAPAVSSAQPTTDSHPEH
jgi:hypothetical protein